MQRPLPSALALICFLLAMSLGVAACGKKPTLTPRDPDQNNENNTTNNTEPKLKLLGDNCSDNAQCESGACRLARCVTSLCNDSQKNGDETDVDCGAPGCPLCDIGKICEQDIDCVSGICEADVCVVSRCEDGVRNGLESDVDCGGLFCDPCADGSRCADASDCESSVCTGEACIAGTCEDNAQNGAETALNCGGPVCEPCVDLLGCVLASDCVSGVCENGLCSIPSCIDDRPNGSETDLNCGGNDCAPCADALGCGQASDCQSNVCQTMTCASAACDDGKINGDETDKDCGGPVPGCPRCAPNLACLTGADCLSAICDPATLKCSGATCSDFVRNGLESDVDCGGGGGGTGGCQGCADDRACSIGSDCASLICTGGRCQSSGCSDGQRNGSETGVDCGGMCGKCPDLSACLVNDDCISGRCVNGSCAAAGCTDGIRNGLETDVDCGNLCPKCADGKACLFNFNCVSEVCNNTTCQQPTCTDGATNGMETDTDCGGGVCPQCALDATCGNDGDCTSAICGGGANGPICSVCRERAEQVTATQCGYQGRGRIEQTCVNGAWTTSDCVGVWYRSCKEILEAGASTGDGIYKIEPDGPAMVFSELSVFCDMTTDGGGWTEITQCNAQSKLNGVLTAVDDAANARITACAPITQDASDSHTYYYTFDWPASFEEFYLNLYEAKANSGVNSLSELGHIQADWLVGYSGSSGDISFGSGTQLGPITSFSRFGATASTQCFDCVIPWAGGTQIYDINQMSTKFRIGWGETGGEPEGWIPWFKGTIRIR